MRKHGPEANPSSRRATPKDPAIKCTSQIRAEYPRTKTHKLRIPGKRSVLANRNSCKRVCQDYRNDNERRHCFSQNFANAFHWFHSRCENLAFFFATSTLTTYVSGDAGDRARNRSRWPSKAFPECDPVVRARPIGGVIWFRHGAVSASCTRVRLDSEVTVRASCRRSCLSFWVNSASANRSAIQVDEIENHRSFPSSSSPESLAGAGHSFHVET